MSIKSPLPISLPRSLSALPTAAAAPCCSSPRCSLAPPPPQCRLLDSPRSRQDLGAGIEDLRPVLALAVGSKERPPPGAARDVRPPSCRVASRTIWDLGAPPPRPSLPRCTSRGRRPKQQQRRRRRRPVLEDLLHGALQVGLTASLS
jgi:hypothetical protein